MYSDAYHHPAWRCSRSLPAMLRLNNDNYCLCTQIIYVSSILLGTIGIAGDI